MKIQNSFIFLPMFFHKRVSTSMMKCNFPFMGRHFKSSALYDYTLAFAYLAIALLMPLLSSIADSRGSKKRFMQFFCYLGGVACFCMFWFKGPMPSVTLGLIC